MSAFAVVWSGATLSDVEAVTRLIKHDWPSAIIYLNEAQDVLACGFDSFNKTVFERGECLPEGLDWLGIDYYEEGPGSWEVVKGALIDGVYPRLSRVGQKVLVRFARHDTHSDNLARHLAAV